MSTTTTTHPGDTSQAMAAMVATDVPASILKSLILGAENVGCELDGDTEVRMKQREEMLSQEMARLLKEAMAAMVAIDILASILKSLILGAENVGYELDGDTEVRMKQREEMLSQEMARLLKEVEELEQMSQEQGNVAWRAMLLAALQQWQFWAIAAVLFLLLVQELPYKGWVVKELVEELIQVYQELSSATYFPVMQPAIGVGSTYEGWSHHGDDAVYCLLVPLKPGRGHSFRLKESITEERPKRTFQVRVQLKCTCATEEAADTTLCFLHHPDKRQRRHWREHFLSVLCTGSYLDVHKTVAWFQEFVMSVWGVRPKMRRYHVKMLPSLRCCMLQLTDGLGRTFLIELMFGLQQCDSDIYLCSRSREVATCPTSTTWLASSAVAEVKFFQHIARQVPRGSYHLKCLRACTQILAGTGFSTSTMKVIVMHLLTTTPLSGWCRRDFMLRLKDIMQYLRCCLEKKHLHHFFIGNDNVPEEISLPPAYEMAEPLNLFQGLAQDPAAHTKALSEFEDIYDGL
ncbi:inositol 1,4,5-trisphosphate receptor-interacting protein-like 1 [Indicator indicator]|uniref:inositol 1,4,5-trisphosphate receptor-interacting protein-like 1 n=1 Tax=Indicator indicator TaxID=1002788 RepID=UPI0023E01E25|nr:inositol 1,4,5-trisphosphate receptor-interacting protein-like 1 [Indicator indicator]